MRKRLFNTHWANPALDEEKRYFRGFVLREKACDVKRVT
jgi:hypothetical protein